MDADFSNYGEKKNGIRFRKYPATLCTRLRVDGGHRQFHSLRGNTKQGLSFAKTTEYQSFSDIMRQNYEAVITKITFKSAQKARVR